MTSNFSTRSLLTLLYDHKISVNDCLECIKPKTRVLKFKKTDEKAVLPVKAGENEVGYDLYVIKKVKKIGKLTWMYDTGIAVEPPGGYFTYLYPRSSVAKTGYMMSNSCGIIDPTYRGSLKLCLTKIDDTLPDIKLPCKIAQLVVSPFCRTKSVEHTTLSITKRGDGGFGSTNK